MKRFILPAIVVVAVGAFATAALAAQPGTPKSLAKRAWVILVCKDSTFAEVVACDLAVDSPVPGASYGTGLASGEIKYTITSAGGPGTMMIKLHGLEADTWYLVTMQDPAGGRDLQFTTNVATCLFGIKAGDGIFTSEFCDVALVKTDSQGNVEALIPTDSGLTGGACVPNGQNGCVALLVNNPNLGTGPYSGTTVVVKNVGANVIDGTTPNIPTLILGGADELFERNALPTFTSP